MSLDTTSIALLMRQANATPARRFMVFPGQEVTYGEFRHRVFAVAKGLIAHGTQVGDHIALLMPNCVDGAVVMLAAHAVGAIAVPINARYKRSELAHVIGHCEARLLFTTDLVSDYVDFAVLIWDALPELTTTPAGARTHLSNAPRLETIVMTGARAPHPSISLSQLIEAGQAVPDELVQARAEAVTSKDVAYLLYTSGTTAAPKACELTHGAIVRSWGAYAEAIGMSADSSVWTPCPFFHVGGIGPITSALIAGGTVLSQIHFTPDAALELILSYRCEHLFPAFPQLTLGILRAPAYDARQLSFVKTVLNVAPPETQRLIQDMLPAGAVLLTDFGMTEGSGMITLTAPDAPVAQRLGSNGKPLPGIEVRIVADGQVLPVGTQGEIQFRGVNAFRSYFKDVAATRSTIDLQGWIRTGDRGWVDASGDLHFTGRIKDILKVGGENVAPSEIEAHLSRHPAVKLAQVIGRPDARYGEVPVAFVELLPNAHCEPAELIRHCVGQLANFKVPREVRFVSEWPMSATKIQKFRLRELL